MFSVAPTTNLTGGPILKETWMRKLHLGGKCDMDFPDCSHFLTLILLLSSYAGLPPNWPKPESLFGMSRTDI